MTHFCFLKNFSDESAIVGLIIDGDDEEYRERTQNFVDWCEPLDQSNMRKTKERAVDSHRHKHNPRQPINIKDMDIETVES